MRPLLTDDEFRLFREWIAEEYGMCFGPEKRDILRARLEPRRAALGFDTFQQLYFHLKFHPEREGERDLLLPHLTNNESYFFRESAQLELLRSEILPAVKANLETTDRREVRLLSAACAAGEEAYSLAVTARESGVFPSPWRVRVTGLDVDPQVLGRAAEGCYTAHAFRGVPDEVRERYFQADGKRWRIRPNLRGAVDFIRGNLVDARWTAVVPPHDVIFCRNVLIYFDEAAISQVARSLYDALVPGGFLFLGHAESLSRFPTPFRPVRYPGAICYRKDKAEGEN